jgi:hypothetical protein
MTATSRETCRDKLAALITAALVGTGKPLVACYAYEIKDLAGQAPVSLVVGSGSKRKQRSIGSTGFKNQFILTVMTFVPAADSATSWTEQNVEDSLDTIEAGIADVISANRGKSNDPTLPWDYIDFVDDFSKATPVTLGGFDYLFEATDFLVSVQD